MKPKNPFFILSFFVVLVVAFSCGKDSDGPSAKLVRYITEKDTFKTDAIWYADTIYVIKKSTVVKGKLTIRPGTIIKIESMASLSTMSFFAIGTKEQPIIFTSIYDDKHGGDTDGDNGVIKPQPGDWACIGSEMYQARLEFCEFYYGGMVLMATISSQKIENCTFAHCNGFMKFPATLTAVTADIINCSIKNNLFYDNTLPLCIMEGMSIDSTNTFSYNGTGNKQNGIFIQKKELKLKTTVNLQENEVPFVVQSDIIIEDGGHLEFMDGTILKFMPGTQISKTIIGTGSSLNGAMKDVVYTSFKDDAHGGDTNGDGSGTTPHNGDWEGIYGGLIVGWWKGNSILYDNH